MRLTQHAALARGRCSARYVAPLPAAAFRPTAYSRWWAAGPRQQASRSRLGHARAALHDRGALEHEADIAKAQGWLGHANISTTCLYDRRGKRAEDSLVYKVKY